MPDMNEARNHIVLLTDGQEVMIKKVNAEQDAFEAARPVIGCEMIEIVEPEMLSRDSLVLLIDEEGKLKAGTAYVNCLASYLYGSDWHGDPIVGNAVIVKDGGQNLEFLTAAEAEQIALSMEKTRYAAIYRMSESLGVRPKAKRVNEIKDAISSQEYEKKPHRQSGFRDNEVR